MIQQILSLILFRINQKTIGTMHKAHFYDLLDTGKNYYYRFINHPEMNWRVVLLSMVCHFRTIIRKNNAGESLDNQCYIVDDTTVEKTGFRIEGLSRVLGHVRYVCVPGGKQLVLAVFDGGVPLSATFPCIERKDVMVNMVVARRLQSKKKRDRNNADHDRFTELDAKKNETAVEMIRRAWNKRIRLPYALMNSWFVSEKMVAELRKIGKEGIHLIGHVKMGNQKYSVEEKKYNVHELIALNKWKASQCRKYKCLYFEQRVMMGEAYVKLVFVKMGRNATWDVLMTTDTHMKFIRVFELYQIRWNIEVIFRECRQYIGLGGYQGTDFEAHIADNTLCMMTHILLALEKRFCQYEAMGELFREERKSLLVLTLWKRILLMIEKPFNHTCRVSCH